MARLRRSWKEVALAPAGDAVLLDGKVLKSPAGLDYVFPTAELAKAVAAEWAGQGPDIDAGAMPLTQLMATATDKVATNRAAVLAGLRRYAETDLTCYQVESPTELLRLQTEGWDPLLAWLAETHGARLQVTRGVSPVSQPAESLAALAPVLEGLDDLRLCALQAATAAAGSLVIALALLEGRIDGAEACRLCLLDEQYQADRWGHDREAEARWRGLKDELAAVELFLALLAAKAG